MNNIRNLNIWKNEPKTQSLKGLRDVDISELNLSVRSFNCLKRANCHTVGDILDLMDEDGNGLRNIRNLGSRSESEIKENVEGLKAEYAERSGQSAGGSPGRPVQRLVKPAKTTMNRPIDEFPISGRALKSLQASGVRYVRDLYDENMFREPGWFAVRELFEQILLK